MDHFAPTIVAEPDMKVWLRRLPTVGVIGGHVVEHTQRVIFPMSKNIPGLALTRGPNDMVCILFVSLRSVL